MQPTPGIRTYDSTATALAFPLGGIGTGNVSLGARGDFRDWELFGTAAKGTALPNTFFCIRVQTEDQEPRIVRKPYPGVKSGSLSVIIVDNPYDGYLAHPRVNQPIRPPIDSHDADLLELHLT
jgi:hypothetical protein